MIENILHVKIGWDNNPAAIIMAHEISNDEIDGNPYTGARCEEDAALLADILWTTLPGGTMRSLIDTLNERLDNGIAQVFAMAAVAGAVCRKEQYE